MKAVLIHLLMVITWPISMVFILVTTTFGLLVAWVLIILGWYTLEDNKIKFGRNKE